MKVYIQNGGKLFPVFLNGNKTCFIDNSLQLQRFLTKMQEPSRYNLHSVLLKNMKAAQRKIYLHRIIYIASYVSNPGMKVQESRSFIILIDSNIKLINEDYNEDILTGFGLFYTGYFINVIEGPESSIERHLSTLLETLDKNLSKTPEVNRMKILLMTYHINKRFFSSWNGRQATPPVLLDKLEPTTSPEVNARYTQQCAIKLYKIYDYLRSQPPNLLRAAMDNVSELCQAHLPEAILLDFLLDSPGLLDLRKFIELQQKVPECTFYDEVIWPLPSDFVPYNVLGETQTKKLMSVEAKDGKEEEKEEEIEGENEEEGGEGENDDASMPHEF